MSIRNLAHTPGPWKVADTNNDMTCVYSEDTNIALLVHKKDARLIITAPDMFDICEELANINWDLLGPRTFEKLQNKAKQIIIKIDGGQ